MLNSIKSILLQIKAYITFNKEIHWIQIQYVNTICNSISYAISKYVLYLEDGKHIYL